MLDRKYLNEVEALVTKGVEEFILWQIGLLDEETLSDEDAYKEAILEIDELLKGESADIVREAEREAQARLN